jgi:hypothetical protein
MYVEHWHEPCETFECIGDPNDLNNQEVDVCRHCDWHRLNHAEKENN